MEYELSLQWWKIPRENFTNVLDHLSGDLEAQFTSSSPMKTRANRCWYKRSSSKLVLSNENIMLEHLL
jgi:hypothetical protein